MTFHAPSDGIALFSVTDRLGIDLASAIRSGDCAPVDLSRMMSRCTDCWHRRKCAQWLHETRHSLPEAPASFCPSATDLAVLMPQTAMHPTKAAVVPLRQSTPETRGGLRA